MEYPAGYLSDEFEDEFDGFLSDESSHSDRIRDWNRVLAEETEQTEEQKVLNLYFSIIHGNVGRIIELIDSGLSVNVELQDNWKPLLLAASVGNYQIVSELISRGANVNDHRNYHTVLMAACNCPETTAPFESCFSIVEELLRKGVNVDATTRKRETALMFAASTGNNLVVRKLLSYCNIFSEDNRGWNALFWAVFNNKLQTAQILIDVGLDNEKKDICGNDALHYATMQESEELIKILSLPTKDDWKEAPRMVYNFESQFGSRSIRPQFLPDIFNMLYGMKCVNLQQIFTSVSLLDFLSLNAQSLQDIGVQLPFHRKKILAGLYKFHKHLFKQKSLPIVPKNVILSTVDVSHAIFTTIRQLTVMEASLIYVLKSDCNFCMQENEEIHLSTKIISNNITKLKKTVEKLDVLVQQWDDNNKSVDLISRKTRIFWFKILFGTSITAVASVLFVQKFWYK